MPINRNTRHKIFRRLGFISLGLAFVVFYYFAQVKQFNQPRNPKSSINSVVQLSDSNIVDSSQKENKQIRKPKKIAVDSAVVNLDSLRKKIMKQCLKAADYVAHKSNVSEAKELLAFLQKNLVLARPDNYGIIAIDSTLKPFLGFVVVLSEDAMPPGKWTKIVDEIDGINYFPVPNNCIIDDENNLQSDIIKGLMLLLCGSYTQVTDKMRYGDNLFYHNEDRKAHEMINKVLLNLGGERYSHLLENEIVRLQYIRDTTAYPVWPGRMIYSDELNEIFSASTSLEIDFIRRLFWINATFAMIEKSQSNSKSAEYFEKNDFLDFPYLRKP